MFGKRRTPSRRGLRWCWLVLLLVFPTAAWSQAEAPDGSWRRVTLDALEADRAPGSRPWVRPSRFRALALDASTIEATLVSAPREDAEGESVLVYLPRPNGGFERFHVVESPVMAPELAAALAAEGWPMTTYLGTSIDRAATTARLDWGGPDGFHAMVVSPTGTSFVDPYWKGDRSLYVSYDRRDYEPTGQPFSCEVATSTASTLPVPEGNTGGQLRQYRLANAAAGEYTQFHGGTQAQGQAAIVTTVNRVNTVYERDLSARLNLVANNMSLVFTNAAMDPYANNVCDAMTLMENQATIDAMIGTANYDIGHVFNTAMGGVALPDSPCNATVKAWGCTGRLSPMGDPFDIDFVAHEMGHQFGAAHTWNGMAMSCDSASWAAMSAYEPGSGTTIMGYAGLCGADDVQAQGNDYFHRRSLDQILSFMSGGGACSTDINGVNPAAPSVGAGPAYTIPMNTPFELTAIDGLDADNDTLSYNWEQFDLGTRAPLATGDDGVQPIFRSFPSSSHPTRVFPTLSALLANTTSTGETLPVTNRIMNFRVTARDNRAGGGREGQDATTVTSTTSSGPFRVTAPNGGETIMVNTTVTWDVANTTAAPVSAAMVDIYLSADGGMTYPFLLASATANDGSEMVALPAVATTQARIKVKGTDNIFFDLSNGDFTINAVTGPQQLVLLDRTGSMSIVRPGTGNSRCADALELAKQDVTAFATNHPGSFVAVWTFAGDRPTDLAGGFVDPAIALAALNALGPDDCTGSTPLAEAMCDAADAMSMLGTAVTDKRLAVSSDGGENNSSGDCAGPSSNAGPPWDLGSWQDRVQMRFDGLGIVQARFWGSVVFNGVDIETGEEPEGGVPDSLFFEYLANITGGVFQGVDDSDPLPPPFGGDGAAVIPTAGFLGLVALGLLLTLAGLMTLRRV